MAAKKKKVVKKATKKKAAPKKVAEAPVDPEQEATPEPAIVEESTMKVVEHGQARYYTESEYRAKYGKKQ